MNDKGYAKKQVTPLNTTETVDDICQDRLDCYQTSGTVFTYQNQQALGPFVLFTENETPVSGSTPLQESFMKS